MNVILWLVAGCVMGWIANVITRTDPRRAVVFNFWVGIVGAALGGWFLSLLVGAPNISDGGFNLTGLLASPLGAVILLTVMNRLHEVSRASK